MTRFSASVVGLALALTLAAAPSGQTQEVTVYKSESCGCCALWIKHLDENGFTVTSQNLALGALARVKAKAVIKPELQSCHTAKVVGYVVEGHVPAADIRALLAAKPGAIGLTVPGMPIGSPGMEAGDNREPYDVLLINRDGSTRIFARH